MLGADLVWPLWGAGTGGFDLRNEAAPPEAVVVAAVRHPVLLGFALARPNGRAMLVLGGGYVALMAGREGVQVARWLAGLGYHAFVLVHRFPDAANGPAAPLDDAIEAMRTIRAGTVAAGGVGVVGLSSGGHLAACLVARYPAEWTMPASVHAGVSYRPDVLVVGYGPISTNAKGRTIVADKPPLPPAEKQAMYDRLQPDAGRSPDPPPAFNHALAAAGSNPELHIFADAPHGFALDTPGLPVALWPDLCAAWLRQQGFA